MRLGKYAIPATFAVLAFFASCSSSSDEVTSNSISAVVQDLDADPTGQTTTLTFVSSYGLSGATIANFASEDGETATSVDVSGAVITVEWDGRVTSTNRVRATGLTNIPEEFFAVTASDDSAPAFVITGGAQTAGLGGDGVVVTWSGPYVVESDVEDLDNWTLTIDGTTMDLDGSTFVLNPTTQVLTITLGNLANLHADFEFSTNGVRGVNDVTVSTTAVAGTATGDAVSPTLTSAVQNLDEDEFGRVVDFTFSEAMDPVFSTSIAHFTVAAPATATSVEQPSENVLRVSFSAPIVPAADDVDLSTIVDAHGNSFTDATVPVTQPSPVVNAFATTPAATTVADAGGDTIVVETTQALDPDTAEDPASWTLVVDGNTIQLADQTLTYDLLAKTLTVDLAFDMSNGVAFTITGVSVLDVDGQTFAQSSGGTVSGDSSAPLLSSITQNRNVDSAGKTLDVRFSEDVLEASAETLGNYVASGAMTLQSATLLVGLDAVRLVYDAVVVPGDVTIAVSNVEDLAGNTLTAVPFGAVISTDSTSPSPTTASASAVAGGANDLVTVQFNDDMLETEIEDGTNWTLESPVGSSVSTASATIAYTSASRTVILALTGGGNFQRGDEFQVAFTTCRDIGGNTVTTTTVTGDILAEDVSPEVHAVYRESSVLNELVVTFTEPCANLDDLYDATTNADGTRYDLRDSVGVFRGRPISATFSLDELSVRLGFAFTVASTDTLDVFGTTDLCGNALIPALNLSSVAEDTSTPSFSTGASAVTAISGENNDEIVVVFDRPMNPWGLNESDRYELSGPNGLVDLTFATFSFDGASTVTIRLRANTNNDLTTGANYSLSINGVFSSQAVERTVAQTETPIAAIGDTTAPVVATTGVRLDPSDANSLLVTTDETVDVAESETATNYDLNSGTIATAADRIGARVIRVTFGVAPIAGDTLDFTLSDLASNATGTISRAVTVADANPPLVSSVTGVIVPGYGGDYVDVVFDEPVTTSVLTLANWSILSNGIPLVLTGARLTILGTSNTVRVILPNSADLDANGGVNVTIQVASDHSGNLILAPIVLGGSTAGDSTAPSELGSFVNWRVDPTGTTIDIWFDEDVDVAVAGIPASWSSTGGSTVSAVEMFERDHYRLTLSASLGASDTVSITSLDDTSRNTSGLLTFDPLE